MPLRLPVLGSVERSRPVEPFVIPDPDGGAVGIHYRAFPANPPAAAPSDPGRPGVRHPAGRTIPIDPINPDNEV